MYIVKAAVVDGSVFFSRRLLFLWIGKRSCLYFVAFDLFSSPVCGMLHARVKPWLYSYRCFLVVSKLC